VTLADPSYRQLEVAVSLGQVLYVDHRDPCPPSGTRCVCPREITLGTGGPGRNPARPRLRGRGLSPAPGGNHAARPRRTDRARTPLAVILTGLTAVRPEDGLQQVSR
jgi:hypothetical protein